MKLDVSNIVKVNGAVLDVEFDGNVEQLDSVSEVEFNTPVRFKGHLVNNGGVLKLDGRLNAGYTAKCSRCLKDVAGSLDIPVREDFVHSAQDTEGEAYTYEDNLIGLDRVLRDNIVLGLPSRQLCSEDCRGICPGCGVDLNLGKCECREETINPQMEALKSFFDE